MNKEELNNFNETLDKMLNEDILSDLKDDIVNSKTVKNIKQGINKVGQNIKNMPSIKIPSMKQIKSDINHAFNKNDISTEEGTDKELQYLFDKYVPREGAADTIGGEIIRALNKLIYRFYNDGDMFCCNYGIETCAPCAIFLEKTIKNGAINDLLHDMSENDIRREKEYESQLKQLTKLIVQYLTDNKQLFKIKNTDDMYNYEPDENDMEYYYDLETSGRLRGDYHDNYESIEDAAEDFEYNFRRSDIKDSYIDEFITKNIRSREEVAGVTVILEEYDEEYDDEDDIKEEPCEEYASIVCSNVYFRL